MILPATGPLLDHILDLTYPLWNEGLGRTQYAQWNAAQQKTRWGRGHLQRLALVDSSGALLATAKRYRFTARIGGVEMPMCGLGAVFTAPERRGRGHARELIDLILEQERTDGVAAAALFTEIGTPFYEALGFQAVPMQEVTVSTIDKTGTPAMLVRAGDERDLPAVAAMHEVRTSGVPFALKRDASHVHFSIARRRLLAGLGPAGLRQVEFFVAEEGASAVAYVVLSQNVNGWTLEDAGDRDPAGARLGAMLQVLFAREPSHRRPLVRAWWPAAFPVPPQLRLTDVTPPRDILMMRSLTGGVSLPTDVRDVFYWHADHF